MTIIHESADILHYEDGAPYIHDILTNNTNHTIVETQYCMLAYNENGSPLKLYWNSSVQSYIPSEAVFENLPDSRHWKQLNLWHNGDILSVSGIWYCAGLHHLLASAGSVLRVFSDRGDPPSILFRLFFVRQE